jgi:hypothetical protein
MFIQLSHCCTILQLCNNGDIAISLQPSATPGPTLINS